MESYYKNLEVWKISIDLAEKIYRITEKFPHNESFGLMSQLRRASISIPSNIAEGSGRSSDIDNTRFLYMAKGSAMEIETQIIIAERLEYIDTDESGEIQNQIEIILKMITKLIQYKKSSIKP